MTELHIPLSDLVVYRKSPHGCYRIRWVYEDGVLGQTLGADLDQRSWDLKVIPSDLANGDHLHLDATRIARAQPTTLWDSNGFAWNHHHEAEFVLNVLRKTFAYHGQVQQYEDAALCNGWLPPRGWLPGRKL